MSQPKKVLFILPNLEGGGAERVVLTLLRFIDRKEVQPVLYLLKKSGVYWDEVPEDIDISWASSEHLRLRQNLVTIASDMRRLVGTCDLVVGALELDATFFAYAWAKLFQKPVVGWVHTLIQPYLSTVPKAHASLVKWVYPRLNGVIFPSRAAMESMFNYVKLAPPKCCLIPNPLDLKAIKVKAAEDLPFWAAPIFTKPVVMAMGRLEYEKGIDQLIRAHAFLLQQGIDHHLLILGEGRDRQVFEALVDELGVRESVYLPGFLSNPYSFLYRAQLFVHASRNEGFGMAVVEALALGIPVVATACAQGVMDILAHGRYGVEVPADNIACLTDAVKQLFQSPERRESLAQAGMIRAADFHPDAIAQEWQSLIMELVE